MTSVTPTTVGVAFFFLVLPLQDGGELVRVVRERVSSVKKASLYTATPSGPPS